jgi:hypothetical protein
MIVTPNGKPYIPTSEQEVSHSNSISMLIEAAEQGANTMELAISVNDLLKSIVSGNIFKSIINMGEVGFNALDSMDVSLFSYMLADRIMGVIPDEQMKEIESLFEKSFQPGLEEVKKMMAELSPEITQALGFIKENKSEKGFAEKLDEIFKIREEKVAKLLQSEMDDELESSIMSPSLTPQSVSLLIV